MVEQHICHIKTRKGSGRRVKSGCRTCKIRKVKCDESRPFCRACLSTGRTCDGYGIWSINGTSITSASIAKPNGSIYSSPNQKITCIDSKLLDWYADRMSTKISGPFGSGFFQDLVLKACWSEPAVLQATLALSCAHQTLPKQEREALRCQDAEVREKDWTLLCKYNKAIASLQSHSQDRDRSAIQITLATCVVFIGVECLRGHYRSAIEHLRHGMKLMHELTPTRHSSGTDKQLEETILRLYVRIAILNENFLISTLPRTSLAHAATFTSALEARAALDNLSLDVLSLRAHHRNFSAPKSSLYAEQHRLQTNLNTWLSVFTTMETPKSPTIMSHLTTHSLHIQHSFLHILLSTSLNNTTIDSHLPSFLEILHHNIQTYNLVINSRDLASTTFAHRPDVPRFSIDGSFVSSLFYTSIHCRNRRIRRQAVQLIEAAKSREAIWDAVVLANVAREVIRMEECDWTHAEAEGNMLDMPSERQLSVDCMVPLHERIWDLHIELPDDIFDKTVISCRRLTADGDEEFIVRSFDPIERRWIAEPS